MLVLEIELNKELVVDTIVELTVYALEVAKPLKKIKKKFSFDVSAKI